MTVSKAFSRVLSRSVHHQSLELDEVDSVGFVKPVGSSSIVTPAQETADVLYPSASVDSRFAPDAKRIIGILSSSDSDGETVAARAKPKKRPAELASGSLTPASASSHSTCSVKGEIRAKSEVGLHVRASLKFEPCQSGTKDEGDSTLRWAVIRPSDKSEDHADKAQVKVKREKVGAVKLEQRVAAQTLKRLRSGVTRVAVSGSANGSKANDVDEEKLRSRAISMVTSAFGGSGSSEARASTVVDAFVKEHGASEARHRLLALVSALRQNEPFRSDVLEMPSERVLTLAQQEPREWATAAMHAKRRKWAADAIQEVKPAGLRVDSSVFALRAEAEP